MSLFSNLIITIIASDYNKRKSISSSNLTPKQYLKPINSQNSFLQNTVLMANKFVKEEQIIIVELNEHQNMLSEDLNNIFNANKNIILEPCLQNNGITIILSAIHAKETNNSKARFLITNANYIIKDEERFEKTLTHIITNFDNKSIVAFGSDDKKLLKNDNFCFLITEALEFKTNFFKVKSFTDKSPKTLNKSKKSFIDTGIYLTSVDFILETTKKHFSLLYDKIYEVYKKSNIFEEKIFLNYVDYKEITNLPFKKILQEELENFFVAPIDGGWCPISSLDISLNYNNENTEYNELKEEENEFFINEKKGFY